MSASASRTGGALEVDVAIVGGGLAGLATAVHLARAGRRVACFEPRSSPRSAVGESLEFSAASLLEDVGIDVAGGGAHLYPKTSVRIVGDDVEFVLWPPSWFARPPIWCSRRAFHTDRRVLDQLLLDVATDAGAIVRTERVVRVEHDDQMIAALHTDCGTRVTADWYVDASGHNARVLGRALGLEREVLGPSRTAYWARYPVPPTGHATTLHFPAPEVDELSWCWEIPLNDAEISIGAVTSTARARRRRSSGLAPREIFEELLDAEPRLRDAVARHAAVEIATTSYVPCRHRRTVGPNWILVGDAAAMVDPLTSNGVTSALRHAEGAARIVSGSLVAGRRSRRDAWTYRNTAPANIATLDRAIETFLYRPGFRRRFGLRPAVFLYAGTGVVTNSLYSRINPSTFVRGVACAALLGASRAWIRAASVAGCRRNGGNDVERTRAGALTGGAP